MSKLLDSPEHNDNRNYNYQKENFYIRDEFSVICDWIHEGSKVIDLGCGNGSLMKYILNKKNIEIEGIEISTTGVGACLNNNLKASVGEIDQDKTYLNYSDNEFDYAICNVTLQMVMFPEVLIRQMKRIARYQIISFPNFAFFGNRIDLLVHGRMPLPMIYGYEWYNTGHIHQLSVNDFIIFCKREKISIVKSHYLGFYKPLATYLSANFFSKVGIFLCKKY
ncbi:MAG: SAM-dependent methyltransferase [Parcubacteria group bacterium GW2011_GWE2_38_18]|nr:MAG: SAM-dependent methyltransferase [Parcubacteria group bacterium GW2011_GWE2_38_18]